MVDSVTKWLDPVLDFFAKLGGYSGVEAEIYKAETGAEWLATLTEMGIDWISKGLINRGLKALGAVAAGLLGLMKKDLHPRLRKELTTIANHLATRAVYMSPKLGLEAETQAFLSALANRQWDKAVKLAFRTPDELSGFLRSVMPKLAPRKEIEEEEIIETPVEVETVDIL